MLERLGQKECVEAMGSESVNRIKCLGNAVVPQCAEIIARQIKDKMFEDVI